MAQFQAGNNYGKGRPQGSGRNQQAKAWAETVGIGRLIEIAEGKHTKYTKIGGRIQRVGFSEESQLDAHKTVLAYGLGKPTEFVDVSSGGESLFDFLRGHFPNRKKPGTSDGTGASK